MNFKLLAILTCVAGMALGGLGAATMSTSSDHFDGRHFFNPWMKDGQTKSFFQVIKWKLTSAAVAWPMNLTDHKTHPQFATNLKPNEITVTFVNHASFLIQTRFGNILTDPIFSQRASPFSFAGPKRSREPGVQINDLPKVDVIFISHNHYDHLDLDSLKALNEKFKPVFILPLKNRELLESIGIDNIIELDWWQTTTFNDLKITLTPVQHWSARGLMDRNECLWGGMWLDSDKSAVYFAGDTGYGPHFLDTKNHFKRGPNVALLPIGAYEPRWFMKDHHMNPEDAVLAHKDLEAKRSFGMHFGTFQLTDEGIDQPAKDLTEAKTKHALADEAFQVLEFGETRKILD